MRKRGSVSQNTGSLQCPQLEASKGLSTSGPLRLTLDASPGGRVSFLPSRLPQDSNNASEELIRQMGWPLPVLWRPSLGDHFHHACRVEWSPKSIQCRHVAHTCNPSHWEEGLEVVGTQVRSQSGLHCKTLHQTTAKINQSISQSWFWKGDGNTGQTGKLTHGASQRQSAVLTYLLFF